MCVSSKTPDFHIYMELLMFVYNQSVSPLEDVHFSVRITLWSGKSNFVMSLVKVVLFLLIVKK